MTDTTSGCKGGFRCRPVTTQAAGIYRLVGAAVCLLLLLPASSRAQSGVGASCTTNGDCLASNCIDGICCEASCFGTCRSCAQAKTGLDNGTCAPVSDGQQSTSGCTEAGKACSSIGCVAATCFDQVKNGDETGVDCGGACPGCAVASACGKPSDCLSGNCIDGICCAPNCFGTCRSCAQAKTGLDNGTCAPVSDGQQSTSGCTAEGKACSSIGCVATSCFDKVKNGDETDVDCGGSCPGCIVANTCSKNSDCVSGNCIDGICCDSNCFGTCRSCAQATTTQPNGTCAPVSDGQQSTSGCTTEGKACSSIGCVATSCFDKVKSGDETDVDCGGACPGCVVANTCSKNSDCASSNCVDGICCAPNCSGTCRSCAQATTTQPNGTCAQVVTGKQTTNGCQAAGFACDDLGSCVNPTTCVGDCGGNKSVTVDEVLTMVNIALGTADVATCAAGDPNNDRQVTVDEILTAVNNGLNGCG